MPIDFDDQHASLSTPDEVLAEYDIAIAAAQGDLRLAQENVKLVQTGLREAQSIQGFLSMVLKAKKEDHPSEALRSIRSNQKILSLMATRNERSDVPIRALERELEGRVTAEFDELIHTFPRAARDAGLRLDEGSRHPKYTLDERLVQIQFDRTRLETRVITPGNRKATIGIDIPVVIEFLKAEVTRLTGRKVDLNAFLEKLTRAYQAVIEKRGPAEPDGSVTFKAIVEELTSDKAFALDEFVVDLSVMVRTDGFASRVRLDHTRDSDGGILLWKLEDRGYYGHIKVGDPN